MFYIHMSLMFLMCCFLVWAAMIARKRKEGWLIKHRMLALAGVFCGVLGTGLIAYSKFAHNGPHFKTPHAIGGGIAVLLLLTTPILGYLSSKGSSALRMPHRVLGRITTVLALIVLITGIDKLLDIWVY